MNLLSNAAKYTHKGGHVALSLRTEGKDAVVSVKDDGAGIAPDLLEGVFELFVQSRRTLDRSQGGIGVGLTLVRSLVEKHGGSVVAQSEGEGKGSLFTVRLPLASREARAVPARPRREPLPKGALVVVVEDNVDSRQMLCKLLEHRGFRCESAGTGPEGLALIEALRPDAAVVDVGLPGMTGCDIARTVRKDDRLSGIFLIALTGYGQSSDRDRALQSGFDEHMVKPVRVESLVALLANCTDERVSDGVECESSEDVTSN